MATETTNYKLKKPEYNEYVDIGALNENFDALDEKLKEIEEAAGKGGELKTIDESYTAVEGQTVFPIAYATFDHLTDNVFVISGRTMLSPGLDYTVESQKIVLVEGVPEGRTVAIRILKNVNTDAKDSTMSGAYITKGSIPLDRLAEEIPQPTAESLGAVKETELPTKIKSLLTGGEISMVRHIQRGTFSTISNSTNGLGISLSGFTNVEKMSVNIIGLGKYTASSAVDTTIASQPYVSNLTAETLTIKTASSKDINSYYYEVIEFY